MVGANRADNARAREKAAHNVQDNAQEAVYLRLAAAGAALAERVAGHLALTPAQVAWVPPNGGWSIAQVYEHMAVAAESYLDRIDTLLPTAPAAPAGAVWRPSLLGGMLARMLRGRRRLPAPRIYRVDPRVRDGAVGRYLDTHARIRARLDRCRGLDWTRVRLTSPVTRLMRMNLGDALTIAVVHAERHLEQIERVRAAPGFPTA